MKNIPRQSARFLLSVAILFLALGPVQASDPEPLFSFGVVADVQYGDKETRGKRHYRTAIEKLSECVEQLNERELVFTIQLGDIIDGNDTPEKTKEDLLRVMIGFSRLRMPLVHVVGNHCMHAGKNALHETLKLKSFYYDFTMPEAPGWRFIVLDGNDAGYGVMSKPQIDWLAQKIKKADADKERVILFSHFALIKEAATNHRMKTPEPVLKLIEHSNCVVAYFAGHDHAGGYAQQNGVHHVTVKGIVEAPTKNAFGIIQVYPDKLQEIGFGKEPSREMKIRNSRETHE